MRQVVKFSRFKRRLEQFAVLLLLSSIVLPGLASSSGLAAPSGTFTQRAAGLAAAPQSCGGLNASKAQAQARPYYVQNPLLISGSPLEITVNDNTSTAINYNGLLQYYGNNAEGAYVWYNGQVYGPMPQVPAGNPVQAWQPVSHTLSGSGTGANPWQIRTVVAAGSSLYLTQTVSYVQGDIYATYNFDVTAPPTATWTLFQAADLYTAGDDCGLPYYDAATGDIGGRNSSTNFYQYFRPLTAADHHMEAFYRTIWDAIGNASGPGAGFNDTLDSGDIDNGAGLQWQRSGNAIVRSLAAFGDVIVPTFTPTPTNTAIPTTTPTATSTATNTATNTASSTATNTATASNTATNTATDTPTTTETATETATNTPTSTDTATPCSLSFPDVPPASLFYDDVVFLTCRQIVNGFPDGNFWPNRNTTRGQFAKIVANGFGLPAYLPASPTFSDVPGGYVFYPYVEAAAHAGAITGFQLAQCVGIGTATPSQPCFKPNDPITRAQVMLILKRTRNYADYTPTRPTVTDVSANHYAYVAIETMVQTGIINGAACADGNGLCFRPSDYIRRGELSKVVHRAIAIIPTDTPTVTRTPTKTSTLTVTRTPRSTNTASSTVSSTASRTVTSTTTSTAALTSTPAFTGTISATLTVSSTSTPAATLTPSNTSVPGSPTLTPNSTLTAIIASVTASAVNATNTAIARTATAAVSTATPALTSSPGPTLTPNLTLTAIIASVTASAVNATNTAIARTATAAASTATNTAIATNTPTLTTMPSSTPNYAATATASAILATNTAIMATNTSIAATNTSIVATLTARSFTPTRTSTPGPTGTNTATSSPTRSSTATPTSTGTPATNTPTSTPSATATGTLTVTPINPATTGKLTGVVTDTVTNQPLNGVLIQITAPGLVTNTSYYADATADDGSFFMEGVPPGSYTVTALKSGYNSMQQTLLITAGGSYTLNFTTQLSGIETGILHGTQKTGPYSPNSEIPLRYVAINVGNLTPLCWLVKPCNPFMVAAVRHYFEIWQPDIIMLSEVTNSMLLLNTTWVKWLGINILAGPLLPEGYDGTCGKSVYPDGRRANWDADNASHEHECIAWKTSRARLVPRSGRSIYGYMGRTPTNQVCETAFTAFSAQVVLDNQITIRAIAVHPQSGPRTDAQKYDCRLRETTMVWNDLAYNDRNVIVGGDWNDDNPLIDENDPPYGAYGFRLNYGYTSADLGISGIGDHWDMVFHEEEWSTALSIAGNQLDHAFSKFGDAVEDPCEYCGATYYTAPSNPYGLPNGGNLYYGSAIGGQGTRGFGGIYINTLTDDHPKADTGGNGGSLFDSVTQGGMDHSQIIVDMVLNRGSVQAGQGPRGMPAGRAGKTIGDKVRGTFTLTPVVVHEQAQPASSGTVALQPARWPASTASPFGGLFRSFWPAPVQFGSH